LQLKARKLMSRVLDGFEAQPPDGAPQDDNAGRWQPELMQDAVGERRTDTEKEETTTGTHAFYCGLDGSFSRATRVRWARDVLSGPRTNAIFVAHGLSRAGQQPIFFDVNVSTGPGVWSSMTMFQAL
jgi:hypothetical protein